MEFYIKGVFTEEFTQDIAAFSDYCKNAGDYEIRRMLRKGDSKVVKMAQEHPDFKVEFVKVVKLPKTELPSYKSQTTNVVDLYLPTDEYLSLFYKITWRDNEK